MKNIGLKDQPIKVTVLGTDFKLECGSCKKVLHHTALFGVHQDRIEEAKAIIELYANQHRCPGTLFARTLITFACAIGAEEQLVNRLRADNRIH